MQTYERLSVPRLSKVSARYKLDLGATRATFWAGLEVGQVLKNVSTIFIASSGLLPAA